VNEKVAEDAVWEWERASEVEVEKFQVGVEFAKDEEIFRSRFTFTRYAPNSQNLRFGVSLTRRRRNRGAYWGYRGTISPCCNRANSIANVCFLLLNVLPPYLQGSFSTYPLGTSIRRCSGTFAQAQAGHSIHAMCPAAVENFLSQLLSIPWRLQFVVFF
jgi:hypothetical protein